MQADEVAGKGRPSREWKVFEKETIIEHITRNREKLALSRSKLSSLREDILSADNAKYQVIVNDLYSNDEKLRRSLLNFTGAANKKKEGERRYEMIGVSGEVKEVFTRMKEEFGYSKADVSSFMSDLMAVFCIVHLEREEKGILDLPISELKGRVHIEIDK
jgi:hypothetical protein